MGVESKGELTLVLLYGAAVSSQRYHLSYSKLCSLQLYPLEIFY